MQYIFWNKQLFFQSPQLTLGQYTTFLKGTVDKMKIDQQSQSYLGILSHANQHDLSIGLKNAYWTR